MARGKVVGGLGGWLWEIGGPRCAGGGDFEIGKPGPKPATRCSNERLPCSNGSKMRCMASGSIPIPVSRTLTVNIVSDGFSEEITISPPSGVNLIAFFSRFQMIY